MTRRLTSRYHSDIQITHWVNPESIIAEVANMERHRGQSLVELALITPILLIMILISVDGARVFTAHLSIGNAAREGASVASRNIDNACDELMVRSAALQEVGPAGTIFGTAPTVDIQYPEDCGEPAPSCEDDFGYACARVTVNYQFDLLFDFPGLPGQIDIQRTAQMRMLGG